ncbi:MAG: methyltransferase domain-containing protein [Candidatus Omnitrophota bacterium]
MCNANCIIFGVHNLNSEEIKGKRVIEVGSYDVNGSLRSVIERSNPGEYVGIDVVAGPGVDVVCPVEGLVQRFGKESFDLVLSTCTLEHIRYWKKAVSNIKNICKANGIILLIVPSQWDYHEYPFDFWRYHKEDIKDIFSDCNILLLEEDAKFPSLVYAKIRKPQQFKEKDLSDYKLYSIIDRAKVKEIEENRLRNFQRIHRFKTAIKRRLKKLAGE